MIYSLDESGFHLYLCCAVGYLEQLTIKIPWTALTSEPIVIEIQDLFILAVPSEAPTFSADAEEENVCGESALFILL